MLSDAGSPRAHPAFRVARETYLAPCARNTRAHGHAAPVHEAGCRRRGLAAREDDMDNERSQHRHDSTPNAARTVEQSAEPSATQDAKGVKNGQNQGSVRWRNGKADVRFSLGGNRRKTFKLPTCKTPEQAEARRVLLAELIGKLAAAERTDLGMPFLEQAATREGRTLNDVVLTIERLAKGELAKKPTGETTIEQLGEMWLSGELARRYPGHIKAKTTTKHERGLLNNYVYPIARHLPVARFTVQHALEVLSRMTDEQPRRMVAWVMNRLMNIAAFPMQLIERNPLPRGFIPKKGITRERNCLYPDEEALVLGCTPVPLEDRMLYGFLDREGMRQSEAWRLEPRDFDLVHGTVSLGKNKTNNPRTWALRPDTLRAMRVWIKMRDAQGKTTVFDRSFLPAQRYRDHLRMAGVDRALLYVSSKERINIRFHDMRATFVTLSLANGKSEAWCVATPRSKGTVRRGRAPRHAAFVRRVKVPSR
jgi:integrase